MHVCVCLFLYVCRQGVEREGVRIRREIRRVARRERGSDSLSAGSGEGRRAHPPRASESRYKRKGVLIRYVGRGLGPLGREGVRIHRAILRIALRDKGF